MKQKYWQIGAAFLIGLFLPLFALLIGTQAAENEPTETIHSEPTETQIQTQPTETAPVTCIQVLQKSGDTVQMELEAYLVGVVLAEMSTSYDLDALCAQAVVARTYALRRQEELRHPMGAVCTDAGCCQAYVSEADYLNGLGYQQDVDITQEAVSRTEGVILTYEGKPIEATYFSCSGGSTEDAVAVWGVSYPYLQAVLSPGEENMKNYSKEVFFSRDKLELALGTSLPDDPHQWFGLTVYTAGGGVEQVEIAGEVYTGLQLRSLLKLNSTAFSVKVRNGGVLLTTLGKGHRVGMSQSGAQAMALRGYGYETILTYYYPGAIIDKLENLG